MKATGIVRRIDDLGRVVIPKEIRRTMRIREGDPLEIYTNSDGEVIFKKYSPIGELGAFASQFAEVLNKTGGLPVIICDKDHVIAVAGVPKKEFLDRRVSADLELSMDKRKDFIAKDSDRLRPIEGMEHYALVSSPIVSSGDVGGAVMYVSENSSTPVNETQSKLIQAAALFLGKQLEE